MSVFQKKMLAHLRMQMYRLWGKTHKKQFISTYMTYYLHICWNCLCCKQGFQRCWEITVHTQKYIMKFKENVIDMLYVTYIFWGQLPDQNFVCMFICPYVKFFSKSTLYFLNIRLNSMKLGNKAHWVPRIMLDNFRSKVIRQRSNEVNYDAIRVIRNIVRQSNPIQSTFVKRHQSSCLFRGASQKHRGKPLLLTISVLGSFTCITQHTGPTALRPIRRTKQLWLSVLVKDTSAATGNRTHILVFQHQNLSPVH